MTLCIAVPSGIGFVMLIIEAFKSLRRDELFFEGYYDEDIN
jgi:hypothetical protein